MGNPNVHDHTNLPILVAGGAAGGMKGGRHIRYDKPTPLANLHLTLLDKVGVRLDSFADSNGKVDELFEPLLDLMSAAIAERTIAPEAIAMGRIGSAPADWSSSCSPSGSAAAARRRRRWPTPRRRPTGRRVRRAARASAPT